MSVDASKFGMKRAYLRQGVLILLPVVLLFGLAETMARFRERWVPPLPVDIGQGFDAESRLFVPVGNGYLETHPDKRVSFQHQRFLRNKPPGTLRIFALGGSSVNYLDYEFSQMRDALRVELDSQFNNVEIINCGGLSYGSHRLVLVASEIMQYDPDLVIVYSGHNEFEEVQQMHLAGLRHARFGRLLARSALFRFLRDVWARRQIAGLKKAQELREMAVSIPDSSKAWLHTFTPEEIQARMSAFEANLKTIIGLCRQYDIPVVLGTVPSNLFRPNLPGENGASYEAVIALFEQGDIEAGLQRGRELLRNASPRHQSSDAENEIIREVAREPGVFFVDVEAAIIAAEPDGLPGQTLFNDHCHLNPEGNRILRTLYQNKILTIVNGEDASEVQDALE